LLNMHVEINPDVVIHTAGIASVDYCEKNYDEAYRSNVKGTENIISFCRARSSKLVYISTNAIFDGAHAPYSESDKPCPINMYGSIKAQCEKIVEDSGLSFLIIRPILMYGWNNENERPNPVTWLLAKLQRNEKINIVNDVYENPLFNLNCADFIWSLVKHGKRGTCHVAGRDVVNRYEFAVMVAEIFGLRKDLINSVSSDFFPDIAPRPKNTSYNTKKIESDSGINPMGLREGLEGMKSAAEQGRREIERWQKLPL